MHTSLLPSDIVAHVPGGGYICAYNNSYSYRAYDPYKGMWVVPDMLPSEVVEILKVLPTNAREAAIIGPRETELFSMPKVEGYPDMSEAFISIPMPFAVRTAHTATAFNVAFDGIERSCDIEIPIRFAPFPVDPKLLTFYVVTREGEGLVRRQPLAAR
jgi:hypothetical protein